MKCSYALTAIALLAGPALSDPIQTYQASVQNKVLTGSIVQVSDAGIAASQTAEIVGGVTGASAGSALGSLMPGGTIIQIASIISGGVLGAAAGTNVANHFSSKPGQDLFIRLDHSGELVNITQPEAGFNTGDNVMVIYSVGGVRVVRNNNVPKGSGI